MKVSRSTVAAPDEHIGKTVANKYRVEQMIGEGGMGKVYKATQLSLGVAQLLRGLRGLLRPAQGVLGAREVGAGPPDAQRRVAGHPPVAAVASGPEQGRALGHDALEPRRRKRGLQRPDLGRLGPWCGRCVAHVRS